MRHPANRQAQAKVAVYSAQAPSPEQQQQFQERLIACALIGLGLLAAFSKIS